MNSYIRRLLPWTFPVVLVGSYIWAVLGATAATQSSVGEIQDVQGSGWGISALGEKYDKLGGDLLVMDEVVATGFNSAMTMRFIDNTTMTLGPNAEITIDQMVYNPDDSDKDAVTFRLGKGSFYFVSGLVAKNKVTIITPTATIGIRGTELVIDVDESGATAVGVAKGHAFMRSNSDGRSVEVEVGNTARTNNDGVVSKPFPGIDLTGDEKVDRKIPGVSEWLDEDDEEHEQDRRKFSSKGSEFGEKDHGDEADKGKRAKNKRDDGEDGRDRDEHDDSFDEDMYFAQDEDRDSDELASSERESSERESSEREGSEREGSERESSEREGSERESSERESSDRESDSDSNDSDDHDD